MRPNIILLLISVLIILSCNKNQENTYLSNKSGSPVKETSGTVSHDSGRIEKVLDIDTSIVTHIAYMKTTMGDIKLGLFGVDAPITVRNFTGLAKKGFYNGILFHRIAKNFLIQAGDRNTRNQNKKADWGKEGESIYGEEFEDELDPNTPSYEAGYLPGTLAMANHGKNTNSSQFFICLEDAVNLEHKWTIFGTVLGGMDVVEKISTVPIEPGQIEPNDGMPRKPVKIISVVIKENKKNLKSQKCNKNKLR